MMRASRPRSRAAQLFSDVRRVLAALFLVAVPLAHIALLACGKFNGPANPENAPWPVICEGGGRCPVDSLCRPGGMCRPLPGPFGTVRVEADFPQALPDAAVTPTE